MADVPGRDAVAVVVALDYYLDLDTYDRYHKESGIWVLKGCLKGDTGATGPAGASADQSGWWAAGETWTRIDGATFAVSGDVTAKYRKGTKVRWKNGAGDLYGVVYSATYGAPNTTVALIPTTDFAMAAGVTDHYVSYAETPEGFPQWFHYTPSVSCSGSMTWATTALTYAIWHCSGGQMDVHVRLVGTTGGTASTTIIITLPVLSNIASVVSPAVAGVTDGSAMLGFGYLNASGVNVRRYDSANFGLGSGRVAAAYCAYDI